MTAQFDPQAIHRDLVASLSRSYLTAVTLLKDATKAEVLVVEAVESLDPEDVSGDALRDAVIERLVHAQIMTMSGSPFTQKTSNQ